MCTFIKRLTCTRARFMAEFRSVPNVLRVYFAHSAAFFQRLLCLRARSPHASRVQRFILRSNFVRRSAICGRIFSRNILRQRGRHSNCSRGVPRDHPGNACSHNGRPVPALPHPSLHTASSRTSGLSLTFSVARANKKRSAPDFMPMLTSFAFCPITLVPELPLLLRLRGGALASRFWCIRRPVRAYVRAPRTSERSHGKASRAPDG